MRDATDIDGLSLRVPGISGDGAHNTWLVATVRKFLNNEPVTVSDYCTYNFVWIMDIAAFIDRLIKQSCDSKVGFAYNTVNLACNRGNNNTELAAEIKRRTKSQSEITVQKPGKGLFRLVADRAYEMGFVSHTPMEITDMYLDTLGLAR